MLAVAKKDEPEQTPEQKRRAEMRAVHKTVLATAEQNPWMKAQAEAGFARVRESQAREEARIAAMLQRDRPPAPPKKGKAKRDAPTPGINPTPEFLARYANAIRKDSPTTASGFKMAAHPVYRKHPWFESLCARDDAFTDEDLIALRYYRNLHEQTERSETKCSLASMVAGGGGGNGEPSLAVARAKSALAWIEPLLGPLVDTMRAIALEDLTYQQVAMARFGYREVGHDDPANGRYLFVCEPRSGRHPGQIKTEFVTATKRLTAAVNRRPVENAGVRPVLRAVGNDSSGSGGATARIVSDRLAGEIQRRVDAGRPVGLIDIAQPTLADIIREHGFTGTFTEQAEQVAEHFEHVFAVQMDWRAGWVLNDGEAER